MGAPAGAAELNKPNETITEFVIGFDSDPERAEEEAIAEAATRAIDGDYETKGLLIEVGGGICYTRMLIEHKIYMRPTQTRDQQVVAGYGNSCERAYEDARDKATALLSDSCRSTARINDKKDERAQSRCRANSAGYWIKSATFAKYNGKWTCIMKFEYLKDKEAE
ncbi:hypothetical protein H5P28_02370 [Ruficoccus amylovorans]|uniref:Uncharacterized protein n=1 Tax=Ruficoccus amylovorans TaxID=1804625 RepID=A0A842HBV4_9BACT|nr:hypothetical protein [Ruficoccus amylovorans]MBC2593097.1 hypothetical protein [Ruficoccus amylovorans]